MRKTSIFSALLLVVGVAFAQEQVTSKQDEIAVKYAATITQEDLKEDLSILASDALEGRETGKRGQKMAAAYIRTHFEEIGLQAPVVDGSSKSYYQKVPLKSSKAGAIYVVSNGTKLINGKDIYYSGTSYNTEEITTEVIFGGSGSVDELEGLAIKGKSVLIINGDRKVLQASLKYVQEQGGVMLFAVPKKTQEEFAKLMGRYAKSVQRERLGLDQGETPAKAGTFLLGPEVAATIFNKSFEKLQKAIVDVSNGKKNAISKIKSSELTYKLDFVHSFVPSENVLGYLEGTDLKDEVLIITGHYDHLGIKNGEIYNGADDDGSGTVAVMDIAEAFAKAKEDGHGPRRSILFMAVTAEEKGLLGSEYYSENPIFPLSSTVANLNIDMIGRIGYDHPGDTNYVYVIGADRLSSELHAIGENANSTYMHLDLDYTYNDVNDKNRFYYRSDHYNFAKHNIPIIFYFNGAHEDYHKPTDTIEKIEFELLQKRAQLVFYTAWEIVNRDGRLIVDMNQEETNVSK